MKPRHLVPVCLLLAAVGAAGWFWFPGGQEGGQEWKTARPIISALETYRQREGHLPDPADIALMQSLGFELRIGFHPDYQPISQTSYVLTFFDGFDGPNWMYESSSGKWSQGYPPPSSNEVSSP